MAEYPGNTTPQNVDDQQLTLKKILLALIGGGPDGPIPVAPSGSTVVNTTGRVITATAGQTKSIPAGATSVGVIVLTGTATFGGDALPVGTPVNFAGPLVATDVVFATPGTGIVTYQS